MADDPPRLRPIADINVLPPAELSQALRPLFEAAEPLVDALARCRPFASYAVLLEQAAAVVASLNGGQQIEVLNAHPRIGERAERVSALSFREQGYDREGGLVADQLERVYRQLAVLNDEYERRFGFRFVVFVNRRSKAEILEVLRVRLGNSRQLELEHGLEALFLIAHDRLLSLGEPAADSIQAMQQERDDAYLAVLDELRHAALATFGEERVAETTLQTALNIAAQSVWRVNQEALDPFGSEPLPTHD